MDNVTQMMRQQAREDLLSFCVYSDKFFEVNKHHVTLAEELQAFMEGKTKRLILQTPPRSGKSRIVGEAIAWSMGAMNRRDIIYAGHSINLLEGFSRSIRGRVESMEFRSLFPDVKLKEGNTAINDWATTNDNRLMIYGVGGGITGKGGNCIVKGEKVLTDSGLLDILEVAETPNAFRVASYNHGTNAIEFRKATNSKQSKSGNVYELRTAGGNTLKATGEHKIFVVGRGYTEMARLKKGERVIIHDDSGKLQSLQAGIQEARLRGEKVLEGMIWDILLLEGMHVGNEKGDYLQKMQVSSGGEEMKHLQGLQERPANPEGHTLLILGNGVPSVEPPDEVLLDGVQERPSFAVNEMNSESELETREFSGNVSGRVLPNAEEDNGKGRNEMRRLRLDEEYLRTSQERESGDERGMESSDGLYELPQETPFFKIDTVSTVTRIEGEHDVYDIEVEGNHNFFASGILVHNCLIIDDPYATREDAESDTIRKKVYEWYNSTFYSRRHDHEAGICLIMQRWKEDDLVGQILGLEDWKVVKIPAIDETGTSFWPSRFPVEELEKIRRQIGPYFFESQYQQEPINLSGGDFKREDFAYCDLLELEGRIRRMDIVTFVDPAISQKQEADFTGMVTVGMDSESNNAYVLEIKHLKETPDRIIDELFRTSDKYRNAGRSYKAGIETVQYQKMLALEIRNQMRIRDKFFLLEDVNPQGDKVARIRSILQPRYSNRGIVHQQGGQNVEALELELLKFPNGKHDDLIDSLASAMAMLQVSNTRPLQVFTPDYSGI